VLLSGLAVFVDRSAATAATDDHARGLKGSLMMFRVWIPAVFKLGVLVLAAEQ
jgi:hypothetical protein